MKFDDLDTFLRQYETAYDLCIPPDHHLIVRLDGRGFTRLTKDIWQFEAPFDIRFRDLMAATAAHLMQCGFNIPYAYSQSDEISLLLHPNDDTFNRKTRKILSVLAGEASAAFTHAHGHMAAFDARLSILPNPRRVLEYFRWRQEDAHRNALNAHCYWLLRKKGDSIQTATQAVARLKLAGKHDLLFAHGINFNDLPAWQKRGFGLYWQTHEKSGYNPHTQTPTQTTRRTLTHDFDLPLKDDYAAFIQHNFLPPPNTDFRAL